MSQKPLPIDAQTYALVHCVPDLNFCNTRNMNRHNTGSAMCSGLRLCGFRHSPIYPGLHCSASSLISQSFRAPNSEQSHSCCAGVCPDLPILICLSHTQARAEQAYTNTAMTRAVGSNTLTLSVTEPYSHSHVMSAAAGTYSNDLSSCSSEALVIFFHPVDIMNFLPTQRVL